MPTLPNTAPRRAFTLTEPVAQVASGSADCPVYGDVGTGRWRGATERRRGQRVRQITQDSENCCLVLVASGVEMPEPERQLVLLSILVCTTTDVAGRRGVWIGCVF